MKKLFFLIIVIIGSCTNKPYFCEGDCENGEGKRIWKDGGSEKGTFIDGKLTGKGEQHLSENSIFKGDTYSGEFIKDQYHGIGTYFDMSEKSYYSGEFKFGKPDGQGMIKFEQNSKYPNRYYKGEWLKGKRNGFGEKFWGIAGKYTNNKYVGEWKNDNQHGFGKYTWADGSYYEGSWFKDQQNGNGKYVFANGEVFEGIWVNGYCKELADLLMQEKES